MNFASNELIMVPTVIDINSTIDPQNENSDSHVIVVPVLKHELIEYERKKLARQFAEIGTQFPRLRGGYYDLRDAGQVLQMLSEQPLMRGFVSIDAPLVAENVAFAAVASNNSQLVADGDDSAIFEGLFDLSAALGVPLLTTNEFLLAHYMPGNVPTLAQILAARSEMDLTQTEAAELISSSQRTWAGWEAQPGTVNVRKMHPGLFELFLLKTGQHPTQELNAK